ncbi:hypothetical protein HanHA300_Chr08g0277131 [Helianthus annuus]|nr:hypothetical protein HanHA300_Chr08g0277131 [Helianthus annuus]KAJ0553257.1 hypothetical protein HanHA89_Chr08g0294431 [Helianthus annuus]KAJ0718927.1 hypothetical protein HanLR1_Chr08g0276091 [Helianthus annuus]KAJ0722171.1 hypothetical protein HanOQP8_Chr08g0283701 [Helianthus annuus]
MDCGAVRSGFKKMKCDGIEEQGRNSCDFGSVFWPKGDLTKNISAAVNGPSCNETTQICAKPRSFDLDLNSQDVSISFNHEPIHVYKNYENVQSRDALSECGSTCPPMGEKDSMRIWKEMKQNGFLSSSHGGVSVLPMPKPRGRKKGNESVIKKKIEIAKREQVDRFAKVAAPSGLLNEGNVTHSYASQQTSFCRSTGNDVLELKLSSASTMASENTSFLSNDESENISTVDFLSVKAACVASQWLELLHEDIKGRLAALRRSKKRVQDVTQTELPLLISRELSSSQENNPFVNKENYDLHKFRWTALFDQMDKSLSEEEKHLENSLNQVREMLTHCEHGLLKSPPANGLQQQATLQNNYMFQKVEPILDKDLAVRAAAAAIYSTSSFLQPAENLPCC